MRPALLFVLLLAGCTPAKYAGVSPVEIEQGGWPYRVWAKRLASGDVEVLVQQTAAWRTIDVLEIRREYRGIGSRHAARLCGDGGAEFIDGADLQGEAIAGFDMHFRCK